MHSPLKLAGPVITTYKSSCGGNPKDCNFPVFQGKALSSYSVYNILIEKTSFGPDQGNLRRLYLNQVPTPTLSATCKGGKYPLGIPAQI